MEHDCAECWSERLPLLTNPVLLQARREKGLVPMTKMLCQERTLDLAQVALAWVLAQPAIPSAILGRAGQSNSTRRCQQWICDWTSRSVRPAMMSGISYHANAIRRLHCASKQGSVRESVERQLPPTPALDHGTGEQERSG